MFNFFNNYCYSRKVKDYNFLTDSFENFLVDSNDNFLMVEN